MERIFKIFGGRKNLGFLIVCVLTIANANLGLGLSENDIWSIVGAFAGLAVGNGLKK